MTKLTLPPIGILLITLATIPINAKIANNNYSSSDRFKVIAKFPNTTGDKYAHSTAFSVDQHLFVPISKGVSDGGFFIYDLSNPKSPFKLAQYNDPELREAHSVGFSPRGTQTYAALQASHGVKILDVTNIKKIKQSAYLRLPHIEPSDYDNGVWWLHWAGRYLYVSGSSRGLYIVDTLDINNPTLVKQIPTSQLGNFRLGSIFVIGNLMTITANEQPGISIFNLSDPLSPKLTFTSKNYKSYSSVLNGNYLYLSSLLYGNHEFSQCERCQNFNGVIILDVSQRNQVSELDRASTAGRSGYTDFSSGILHVGSSDHYYKFDVSNPSNMRLHTSISKETAYAPNGRSTDLDFVRALGNLVVLSDDHASASDASGFGSSLVVHATTADTHAPSINALYPPPNASNISTNPLIGISFDEALRTSSLHNNIILREKITGSRVDTLISNQRNIVNLQATAPLKKGVAYEVVILANGVSDLFGNKNTQSQIHSFKTAGQDSIPPCVLNSPPSADINQDVTFSISECHTDHNPVYTWNFGDDTNLGPQLNAATVNHTYKFPGLYSVIVEVLFENGSKQILNASVNVRGDVAALHPQRSSTLALSANNRMLWTVNPDNHSVSKINLSERALLKEIPLHAETSAICLSPSGNPWVSIKGADKLVKLHRDSFAVLQTVALGYGQAPQAIVCSRNQDVVYAITSSSGELLKIEAGNIAHKLAVGPDLRNLALNSDETQLYTTQFRSKSLDGKVYQIDTNTFQVSSTKIHYDNSADSEASGSGIPNYFFSASLSPDNQKLLLSSKKDNVLRGQAQNGKQATFENTVRAIVSTVDTLSFQELPGQRVDLNNRNLPYDIQFSRDGNFYFVSTAGSNSVDLLSALSNSQLAAIENIGASPRSLLISADGKQLIVDVELDRNIVIYDISTLGISNLFRKQATIRKIFSDKLNIHELHGKRLFYSSADLRMAKDNYLSCASCHFDGGQDGQTWDFTQRGEGLRNTTHLTGKSGLGHGRLHWTANFDELQDFENDIRSGFAGNGFLRDSQYLELNRTHPLGAAKSKLNRSLDSLAAYVTSLNKTPPSPFRKSNGDFTAVALTGKQLFNSLNCQMCHAGTELTDSSSQILHDVGTLSSKSGQRLGQTLTGLDTPTLKNLWQTDPYLHLGQAASLKEIFTLFNHGNAGSLSDSEIKQLTRYLQEIE